MAVFVRYIVVGLSALGLHLVVLQGLLVLGICMPWTASAAGFVIACVFNYTMQHLWVFRSSRSHAAALPRYVSVTTVMLGVNTALFALFYRTGLPPVVAQTLVTGVVFVLNFLGNRYITFRVASRFGVVE